MPTTDELRAQLEVNIQADRFLSDATKAALLNELNADARALQQVWDDARVRHGPTSTELPSFSAPDGGQYGHLIRETAFFRHLSARTGYDIDRLAAVFAGIFGANPDLTADEAIEEWNLLTEDQPLRATREIWIFRGPVDDPFAGADHSRIPCRLGLQSNTGLRYVPFRVSSTALNAVRAPCIFDVDFGYSWFWRPTGVTFPACIPPQAGETGFKEFLSEPPLLRSSVPAAIAITSI